MKIFAKIDEKDIQMNENKHVSEEMVRNEANETSEIIDEMLEDIENESSQSIEEALEETPLSAKAKKNEKAKYLVQKAKKIVKAVNDRQEACRRLLEVGLDQYENARSKLKTGGFDACVSLIQKLGSQTKNDVPEEEETVFFEAQEGLKPIVLKDVSSGRVSALIYALMGGFATAVGMVYLATIKLDMSLNVTQVTSEDVIQSILAWFSTLLGIHEDVYIGTGVLGVLVLAVMIFIYVIRVRVKAKCNLHFAVKQFVEAELYTVGKADCKDETEKIDMHIKDSIEVMRTYEILFNEQKGKLERILYVEGVRGKSTEYHYKSHREIYETTVLIDTISEYLNVILLKEGRLSEKSVLHLQDAKDQMNKMLARYY